MDEGFLFLYVTCSGRPEAEKIADTVVGERLVACANILSPHMAVYHWQGKVERGEEVAVIFKTRKDLFEKVKARIVELHSYDVPCVVALDIRDGHGPFLEWIAAETAG